MEEVQCIKYMFLKNKGLTIHLAHPQHHVLYIYMVYFITSILLIIPKRISLHLRHFLREPMRFLPTYFIHKKKQFLYESLYNSHLPLLDSFSFVLLFQKTPSGVLTCKMRQ
jgi:phosphoglycerol transferase MdoB-like AlkP superfamily enzyme